MARPETHKTPLAQRLTQARKAIGHENRAPFAALIAVPIETLAKYERGDREPPIDLLSSYHTRFGINLSWLLSGSGEMFDDPSKAPAGVLDSQLLDRLGRAALQVFGDIKRNLPHSQVSGEAARLYNDLVELGVDLSDADAVEASIPLLQHRLRRRLEQAAADPTTDKRRA
ncbi:helix-turn-helix domain-containing protein [Ensifer sesbaniae]|uniref:helix-turn-helix domain-containing protein n=1 Tax=Ensifer sesbaniae TaxID=1214071 RepID=UPI002000E316|nr:helix-turn-helix domain-containing protein [Ensifer sesbaniae]